MREKQQHWQSLEQEYHDYERSSLLLKAISGVTAFFLLNQSDLLTASALALFFWVLDAIWKTFQQRTADHLLKYESGEVAECSLHKEWQQRRPGAVGLVVEYAKTALKPTLLMPHVLLIILLALVSL